MNQVGIACFSQAVGDRHSVLFNRLFQIKRHHVFDAFLECSGLGLHSRMGLIAHVDDFVSGASSQLFHGPATLLRGLDLNAANKNGG